LFGIGWTEFIVIALVLLIFVGPHHLPGVLRKMGLIINELKNASRELRNQINEEVKDLEQSVGPIKTPKDFMRDLEQEVTDDIGSPYDEIYKAESAVKKEISSIKADIETPARTPGNAESRSADPSDPSSEKPEKPTNDSEGPS
jgi:sec-independent protein translocase protein TatB